MGIGADFKEIYRDTGRPYRILRINGSESALEYGKASLNSQATKPFTVLTTVKGFFPFDTAVIPGDVIRFEDENSLYMVTVKKAAVLEGEIKFFTGILYMVNAMATLFRKAESGARDAKGDRIQGFVQRSIPFYANLSDTMFGETMMEDGRIPIGDAVRDNQTLYVPAPWVKDNLSGEQHILDIGDRLHVQPLETRTLWPAKDYEITGVRRNRYDNVHDLSLREDKR